MVHYQRKHHRECVAAGGANCKTQPNPCELIKYQSLTSTGTTGGEGLTGFTHAQKDTNDHDADGDANDKMALPNQYVAYNGTVLADPAPYHQVNAHFIRTTQTNKPHPRHCFAVRLRRAPQVGHQRQVQVLHG